MASIKTSYGKGGSGLSAKDRDGVDLAMALRAIADDLTALRAAITGLTAKLDADAGVTDVDYASSLDPAALTHTKG